MSNGPPGGADASDPEIAARARHFVKRTLFAQALTLIVLVVTLVVTVPIGLGLVEVPSAVGLGLRGVFIVVYLSWLVVTPLVSVSGLWVNRHAGTIAAWVAHPLMLLLWAFLAYLATFWGHRI